MEPWQDVANLSDDEVDALAEPEDTDPFWSVAEYANGTGEGTEPPQLEEAEDLAEKHDIGFAVVDGNGEPYGGLGYVLEGPGQEREDGELDDSGEVQRKDVASEDYRLVLKSVRGVAWGGTASKAGVEVEVSAAVVGYEDETEVEIRLFRLYSERDDDVLETLNATVVDGRVAATWTYEHDPDGPFATDHGVVSIVAEVRVGADGPWAKTHTPLSLTLPSVDDAAWGDDEVEPGEEVGLSLSAVGVPDGTPIAIAVYQARRSGEELLLEEFADLTVEDEAVELSWSYPVPDDPDAPPVDAECFFVATLDGDANRISVSDNLAVSMAPDEDDE